MKIHSGMVSYAKWNIGLLFFICILSPAAEPETIGKLNSYTVKAIAIHPLDTDIIYAGTIEKGIFKTLKIGTGWVQIWPEYSCPSLRILAVHPAGPDTIYAATVNGLFKSVNNGIDWELMRLPSHDKNEYRAFAVNPRYPDLLFAGGPFDRWKSSDGGNTWEQLNIFPPVGIDAFAVDPKNPERMYFVSGSVSAGLGIWKSQDFGETWTVIQNNIDSAGFGEDIAIDPENTDILYFALNDPEDSTSRCFWKSYDGGENWKNITPPGLTAAGILRIRIFPIDHNTIFICTEEDGVLKSGDGGNSWNSANEGIGNLRPATMEIDPLQGTIYLGTYHGGIFKSTDTGNTWRAIY